MPIYEYHCQACGHEMEEMQKFSDLPLTTCPKCGKNSLEKKISISGFQLKGGGWYATDFKDKKPAPKSEENAKETTAATETKTDLKTQSQADKPSDKKKEQTK